MSSITVTFLCIIYIKNVLNEVDIYYDNTAICSDTTSKTTTVAVTAAVDSITLDKSTAKVTTVTLWPGSTTNVGGRWRLHVSECVRVAVTMSARSIITTKLLLNGPSTPPAATQQSTERKGKEEYLYSAFYILCISQSAEAWITQFYLHHAPCLPFLRKRSPDGATPNWGKRHPIAAYYSSTQTGVVKPLEYWSWTAEMSALYWCQIPYSTCIMYVCIY